MNVFSAILRVYQASFKSLADLFQLISLICGKGADVAQTLYLLLMNDPRYAEVKEEFKEAFRLYLQCIGKMMSGITKLQKIEGVDEDLKGFNELLEESFKLVDIKVIFAEAGSAMKAYEAQAMSLAEEITEAFPEEMSKLVKPEPIDHE